jgi:uncharacterized protein
MDPMVEFSIPIQGLESGQHAFRFYITSDFFQHFDQSLVEEGQFEVALQLEKRTDMISCIFDVTGHMTTQCDRCLETIQLPIARQVPLLFKYADEEREEDEVVFIPRGIAELNMAKYIYEIIGLSVPLVRQYPCDEDENAPCNEDMLDILDEFRPDGGDEDNPIWDVLKGLKDN